MRRQYNVAQLVYNNIYPNPTSADPPDFSQHLIRHLITEVRIETHRFYGGLETIEAKYPGLNYVHPPHRKRLSQFAHHARLFRAFDELGLTAYEIGELCKWEGTLWARQRYERDEGVRVLDTTGNEIRCGIDEPLRVGGCCRSAAGGRKRNSSGHIKVKTDIEIAVEVEDRRRSVSRQDRRRMLLLRRRESSPSSPRASPPPSPSASTPLLPSPPANRRASLPSPQVSSHAPTPAPAAAAADREAAAASSLATPPAEADVCDDSSEAATDHGSASDGASQGPPSSNTSVADDTYMKDMQEAGDARWPPTGAVPSGPPEVQQ